MRINIQQHQNLRLSIFRIKMAEQNFAIKVTLIIFFGIFSKKFKAELSNLHSTSSAEYFQFFKKNELFIPNRQYRRKKNQPTNELDLLKHLLYC